MIEAPEPPHETAVVMRGPGNLRANAISHLVTGGMAWHVWRGSRYVGRVIDRTAYPRDERVEVDQYAFHAQTFFRGSYDEETPRLSTLQEAFSFFE